MQKFEEKDVVRNIVENILSDYKNGRDIDKLTVFHQPDKEAIIDIVTKLMRIFFPGYYRDKVYRFYSVRNNVSVLIEDVMYNMQKQIAIVLHNKCEFNCCDEDDIQKTAQELTFEFFQKIPKIREYLNTDLQATFDGDPAANGKDEIVLCYPGFYATTIYRIAHEVFVLKVPLIPRIMTEYAHSKTGIDIHPGATIGKYFFIDHGTGIVVGSTTTIGNHVKVYQGVTLGALSTREGQKLHGKKRHPTIEDDVTIYSGASILGGATVIGSNSVIGSNAFITKAVEKNSRVSIQNQKLYCRPGEKSHAELKDLNLNDGWY
ncbi:serine O-acetyltransferase EpsC [Lachnobacterium bovis]|uniref:Serine acetyltransferase n=1 Tax=Lachnobacterium bovis DSM 14045 TaxID=1122142 RepID=A0A1H3IZ36_9FIRM|nr:serine O-acetyltransferase EpsC [Lachnobacterium bovis]SDY32971.1 serine O-acetyltransferase [Lachnobacterium bovis DSM 14045]